MRRLGEACGVQGPALYWHFKDKDELLGHIVDSVVGDLESGVVGDPWDQRLQALGRSTRRLMVEHRGLAIVAAGRYAVPERVLEGIEEVLGVLVEAGFTPRQALTIYYAVLTFTTGFAIYETSSPLFEVAAAEPGSPARESPRERFIALSEGSNPHIADAVDELVDLTLDEMFEESLTALIHGWAARIGAA